MDGNNSLPLGFEFVDIEIISHKEKESEETAKKWHCNQCSLFFLTKEKLVEHKNKHVTAVDEIVKCKYCNKTLSNTEESKECYSNRKCETCEYRCSKCPQRFLRHSSLLNHEKNHLVLKKKKSVLTRPITKLNIKGKSTIGKNVKVVKKKQLEKAGTEIAGLKSVKTNKVNNKPSISPKKKRKVKSETPSLKKPVEEEGETLASNSKKPRQSSVRDNNPVQGEKVPFSAVKSKPITAMNNTPTATKTSTPSIDNVVNYKPFSCHVCGDTFASDNALLNHIRSHGENEAKGFKCKHCGDEFDDIYKMQYHLAICPLAEDELETTLNSTPTFLKKQLYHSSSPGVSSTHFPRKRGRPKKLKDEPTEEENGNTHVDLTPSLSTRGSMKKRKIEEKSESLNKTPKITNSLSQKNSGTTRHAGMSVTEHDSDCESLDNDINEMVNDLADDSNEEDPLFEGDSANINDDSFENSEDNRKKVHACPFPRCGIKFTREKALLCHMRNHNDDFDDALKCHKCDIPFDDVQSLRTHMDICKGIKEEKDDDFNEHIPAETDYDSIDKPFRTSRKPRGDFVCKVCGRLYISQEKLDRHLELHRSSSFKCRICNDVYITQFLLDKHFSVKHPTKSPYHCDICNEDFISELFLQIHETEYHDRTTGIIESVSGSLEDSTEEKSPTKNLSLRLKILKRHNYSSTLANSRFTNRNKSQFWCPVCLYSFSQREDLRLHFRTDHAFETDSMFICEVCEIEKPSAEMLCYHLEVHSNNLLSVNRFSKLRACINNGNNEGLGILMPGSVIKIKSEKGSEDEGEIILKQETDQSSSTEKRSRRKVVEQEPSKTESGLKKILKTKTHKILQHEPTGNHSLPETSAKKRLRHSKSAQLVHSHNEAKKKDLDDEGVLELPRNGSVSHTNNKQVKKNTRVRRKKGNLNPPIKAILRKRAQSRKDVRIEGENSKGPNSENLYTPILSTPDSTEIISNEEPTSTQTNKTVKDKQDLKHKIIKRQVRKRVNINSRKTKPALNDSTDTFCDTSSNVNKGTPCDSTGDLDTEADTTSQMIVNEASENPPLVNDAQPTEESKFTSSTDDQDEEICCTMCSQKFYHQDELLDHVASHI